VLWGRRRVRQGPQGCQQPTTHVVLARHQHRPLGVLPHRCDDGRYLAVQLQRNPAGVVQHVSSSTGARCLAAAPQLCPTRCASSAAQLLPTLGARALERHAARAAAWTLMDQQEARPWHYTPL
jgi:hypothetical protein